MKNTTKLEFEYHTGAGTSKHKFRLLSKGKFTPGYKDEFVLQEHSKGELDEDVWTTTVKFDNGCTIHSLVSALLLRIPVNSLSDA